MDCYSCFEGFYLNNAGSCVACPDNCSICENEFECYLPADGFFLPLLDIANDYDLDSAIFGEICERCADKCLTCILEADRCTSCDTSKYALSGSKCIGRFVVNMRFKFDFDYL